MKYLALIGDIKASKSISARDDVQVQLRSVCDHLNKQRDSMQLVSPFTITLGDEFQALFSSSIGIWRCIFNIESKLHPVRIRFGVGLGAIDTEINETASIGMDGPAFHLAREAISSLKSESGNYRVLGLSDAQELVLHTLDLVSHNRDAWRKNRLDIFCSLLEGRNVASMAKLLRITEQAVYKNIRKGQLESVMGIFQGLSHLIELEIGGGD